MVRTTANRGGFWWDAAAVGLSAACLVHCLSLPLLLALLPAASTLLALPDWLHAAAFALAVPASAFAMRRGHRHHGLAMPVLIGGFGLLLLGFGALGGFRSAIEAGLTVAGSVVLAIAHLRNWHLQRVATGCAAAVVGP